jgi:hypothetical protein
MNRDYVEAFLFWNERGGHESVAKWLSEHHLAVKPMKTGLLVCGPAAQFEAAFGVNLENATAPVQLPVPQEISTYTASIGIPKQRQYH